jgi:signal transduction histidine kinase
MRIATRLKIIFYFSVGTLAVLIPALFWSFNEFKKAKDNDLIADQILTNVFERTSLRDDYLIYHSERARTQWHAKKESIDLLLSRASVRLTDTADKAILEEMRKNFDATVAIFSRLEKNTGKMRIASDNSFKDEELQKRLTSQILLKAYGLFDASNRLSDSTKARVEYTYRRFIAIIFLLVVLMALTTILNSTFISRILSRRLAALREGAEIISGGNLDYRIECRGSDEFVDLAKTINSMTENLKSLYTSLEGELAHRKKSATEIEKLNEYLEQYTLQLEAANRELEAFSYSVSHDLRAPLRHITGFVEMLDKRGTAGFDEKSRHYLEVISESAKKMGCLIDDLLSFSRMGRIEMMKTRTDMIRLVNEVRKELHLDGKETDVEFDIKPLPEVCCDPAMVRQVLINLIDNAVKFSRGRKPIRIEVNYQNDTPAETIFFIRDNGVGFDMKYVDKLFSLFQRLHSPEDFEGTGVGLANVQRIIHRHGGRTWAEGEPGKGATFYFSLPNFEED